MIVAARRMTARIVTVALLASGLVVGGTSGDAAALVGFFDGPCRDNMPQTSYAPDPTDPDLTGDLLTDVYMYMDKARAAAGQPPLARSALLASNATGYATSGPATGNLGHGDGAERTANLPRGWRLEGENIYSGPQSSSAAHMVQMWLDSFTHRANILCPDFTHVGVGVNAPGPGQRLHVVQRFVNFPAPLDPDDRTTWLPYHLLSPIRDHRDPVYWFEPDESIPAEDASEFEREVLAAVNAARAAESLKPVVLGTATTMGSAKHVSMLASRPFDEQQRTWYRLAHDPAMMTSVVGSGTDVTELLMSHAAPVSGARFVQTLLETDESSRKQLLDPVWTHIGAQRVPEPTHQEAWYFGLRMSAYPPIPDAVPQDNHWYTSPVTLQAGERPDSTVAVIQGPGPVMLQVEEDGVWVTRNTVEVVDRFARIEYPVFPRRGTFSVRLFSPGDAPQQLDWTSETQTVTVTRATPTSTLSPPFTTTTPVGEAEVTTVAYVSHGEDVALQQLISGTWETIARLPVPENRQVAVKFPEQHAVGTASYRLVQEGHDSLERWESQIVSVESVREYPTISFDTTPETVRAGGTPAIRTLTIHVGDHAELQHMIDGAWKTIARYSGSSHPHVVSLPAQNVRMSIYRVRTTETPRYHAWTSSELAISAEEEPEPPHTDPGPIGNPASPPVPPVAKRPQASSWLTSAFTTTVGQRGRTLTARIDASGRVQLQTYTKGAWRTLKTLTVSGGTTKVHLPAPAAAGVVKYRLVSAGDARYRAWTSPTLTITVKGKRLSGPVGRHDFNLDGKDDLLTVDRKGRLVLLAGNGKGRFAKKTIGKGYKNYRHVVGTGDLSGDGASDVILVTSAGRAYLATGNGKGKLDGRKLAIGTGWRSVKDVFSPGDVNGDGYGDIVLRKSTGTAYVLHGRGDGKFSKAKKLKVKWKSYASVTQGGDYNRDGRADVLLVAKSGKVTIALGNGRGGFKNRPAGRLPRTERFALVLGNVTGDSTPDVVSLSTKGVLKLSPGSKRTLKKSRSVMSLGVGTQHLS